MLEDSVFGVTAKSLNSLPHGTLMGDSTRTIHPYYIPLKRGSSRVKTKSTSSDSPTINPHRKGTKNSRDTGSRNNELTSVKRRPTVRIKRKKKAEGKATVEVEAQKDDSYDDIVDLLEFWMKVFEEAIGCRYEIGTEINNLKLCEKIFEDTGDSARAKAYMRALLTRTELAWVDLKTLEWLSKRANQTRVATVLKKKQIKSRAEYSGDRPTETRIVFRSI